MFSKAATVLMGLCLCSWCLAADGLPDPKNWFIQPLGWNAHFHDKLQISDSYVVWEADYGGSSGTYYYDGAGIYQLGCYNGSLGGSSIVGEARPNILYFHQGVTQLLTSGQGNDMNPDVYDTQVIWQAGPNYDHGGIYYYADDYPVEGIMQLSVDGKSPQVSANGIAWLEYDGEDYEVVVIKDYEVRQLTHNAINEFDLRMSDDGQLAWMTWNPMFEMIFGYVHYYDGEHIRQMTVGNTYSQLCDISEMGVLFTAEYHPNYPEHRYVLLYHNGQQETLIDGSDHMIVGASLGGGSIAWMSYDPQTSNYRVNFRKDQKVTSWPLAQDYMFDCLLTAVKGNRLAWTPLTIDLYFGEYLGSPICANRPVMDGNDDCKVDLLDFAIFAGEWLTCGYDDPAACH